MAQDDDSGVPHLDGATMAKLILIRVPLPTPSTAALFPFTYSAWTVASLLSLVVHVCAPSLVGHDLKLSSETLFYCRDANLQPDLLIAFFYACLTPAT